MAPAQSPHGVGATFSRGLFEGVGIMNYHLFALGFVMGLGTGTLIILTAFHTVLFP